MKQRSLYINYLVLVLAVLLGGPAFTQTFFGQLPKSLIGDKALTEVRAVEWVKGKPIEHLQEGTVYLVEFSTVGCSPCRAAIPHLVELSKKYKENLEVISVYMDENPDVVKAFMDNMPDIPYSVIADGSDRYMSNNWMDAFGEKGTPTAFLVDKSGTIVWIGNPLYLLDEIVHRTLQETFSPILGVKHQLYINAMFNGQSNAKANSHTDLALKIVDQMILEYPFNPYLKLEKFETLLSKEEFQAYTYGWELLEDTENQAESVLWYVSRELCSQYLKGNLKNPDLNLGIALTERASNLCRSVMVSAAMLDTQAEFYAFKGEYDNAIIAEDRAITQLEKLGIPEATERAKGLFQNKRSRYMALKQKSNATTSSKDIIPNQG